MRRRDTLRKCAALGAVGSLGLLAGCSGGGEESESEASASLSVESFDHREGDSGELVVAVTIENAGEAEGTGYLYVTVTAAEQARESENETDENGRTPDTVTTRESREVTVPAGETKTVDVAFDVTYEQFQRRGSLELDLRD